MEIEQLSLKIWVWSEPVVINLDFSKQWFSILYIMMPEFLDKAVLQCIVNSTYLKGCCKCTLFTTDIKKGILYVVVYFVLLFVWSFFSFYFSQTYLQSNFTKLALELHSFEVNFYLTWFVNYKIIKINFAMLCFP